MHKQTSNPAIAIVAILLCSLVVVSSETKAFEGLGKVTIVSQGIELIEVTPTAEKCTNKKGQTVRLRVTSESPVDVRLYAKITGGVWFPKDFLNHKKGDEILDYRCDGNRSYKVYARAAGSPDAWPKP